MELDSSRPSPSSMASESWLGGTHRQGQRGLGPVHWPLPSSCLITVSGHRGSPRLSQPADIREGPVRAVELAAMSPARPRSLAARLCQAGV
ncbi:hypothetical protein MHYP_G00229130 [Metynnis hypsauchen]